ncbi:MAG: DUF167 domain-containing protein [Gaiellaceae bacterium]
MVGPSTRLRLRVSPGASRSEVVGRHGRAWKVRVAAVPESGKANEALVAFLASILEIPRGDVEIRTGRGSRDKTVIVRGLDAAETERRLAPGELQARTGR